MEKIGRYTIISPLRGGSQGTVYQALDDFGNHVALKAVPRAKLCPFNQKRFYRQARALRRLVHPHIVKVLDAGETESHFFLAMEYLKGKPLTRYIPFRLNVHLEHCLTVMRQLAEAVAAIHRREVLHRDIKPDNIILGPNGGMPHATLVDFGLARSLARDTITLPGYLPGTLSYCAPERLQFQRAEPASDVFSLGVVFYEMVTGRKPFPGDSRAMVMEHILHSRPVPPRLLKSQVPKVLSQLILAMLDKRPDRRCPTPRVLDVLSSTIG